MRHAYATALAVIALAAGCAGGVSQSALPVAGGSSFGGSVVTAKTTPKPTPKPTAKPSPAVLTVDPAKLEFTATGQIDSFAVSEIGYKKTFAIKSACTSIASVSPSSASGPNADIRVKAGKAGTCVVSVKDAGGNAAKVTVYVTTTTGIISVVKP
jgi:hypothetical protein